MRFIREVFPFQKRPKQSAMQGKFFGGIFKTESFENEDFAFVGRREG